jgi:hypothetical protein
VYSEQYTGKDVEASGRNLLSDTTPGSPEGNEANEQKPQAGQPIFRQRFKAGTSQIQSRSVASFSV